MGMLLEVVIICAAGMMSGEHGRRYLLGEGAWVFWAAMITSFTIVLAPVCYPKLLHHAPQKHAVLLLFGAATGTTVMYAALQYPASSVLFVAGLTASTTLALC